MSSNTTNLPATEKIEFGDIAPFIPEVAAVISSGLHLAETRQQCSAQMYAASCRLEAVKEYNKTARRAVEVDAEVVMGMFNAAMATGNFECAGEIAKQYWDKHGRFNPRP